MLNSVPEEVVNVFCVLVVILFDDDASVRYL